MSRALAAYDPCGCCASISVLGGHEASAYEMAAEQARAGRRIEEVVVDDWKRQPWHCADHPEGPPWWESNGGSGRIPATYEPQLAGALMTRWTHPSLGAFDIFRGRVLTRPVDPPPGPSLPPPDYRLVGTEYRPLLDRCPHDGIVHTDQRTFTVRDPDDEIVGCGFVHIERMSKHHVWIGLEAEDGTRVDLDLVSTKGKVRMVVR